MKKTILMLSALSFIVCLNTGAWAHHAAVGMATADAGPIKTIPASTLKQGSFGFDVQAEYIDLKRFSDAELLGFAEEGNDVHSIDSVRHLFFGMGYGLTNDLTLGLKLPYVSLKNIRASHAEEPDEVHSHGNSSGLGDLSIVARYRFIRAAEQGFEAALIGGIKAPTGETNVSDPDGERFETEHQPGSGSWDPIIGLAATKKIGNVSLDGNILYMMATKGSQETDLGDTLNLNVAVSWRAIQKEVSVDLVLEANAEWKQKQKIGGIRDDNSGDTLLLLSPGLRLAFKNNMMAYVSAGFPVVQNLNGIQTETRTRTLFGFAVGF
ncbi:MAG: transporter [Thermodesulfovibrionales bacterium]